jgi:NAD(P)-dependent dehydrogenase (short-subunit alcohol dehydrogenase family)
MNIVITGVSSGIGRATADLLTETGHTVYGGSRRDPQTSNAGVWLPLDVTSDESAAAFCAEVLKRTGGAVDVLINNAGYAVRGAIEEVRSEDVARQFDTNVTGIVRLIRGILPAMRARRRGTVINVSSIVGLMAYPYNGIYSATKFAVEALTQALRMETAQFGIRVYAVNPGVINTEFADVAVYSPGIDVYAPLRAGWETRLSANRENAPGPDIVAEAIAELIDEGMEEPNYVVGPDAEKMVQAWNDLEPNEFEQMLCEAYGIPFRQS